MARLRFSSRVACFSVLLSFALVLSPCLTIVGQSVPDSQPRALGRMLNHPVAVPSRSAPFPPPVQSFRNSFRGSESARMPGHGGSSGNQIFFNPASYQSGGLYAFSVATGDFNGDGKLDLVVANECFDSSCSSGSVSVLLGIGDGTFQAAQSYASGGYEAFSVAVGDVNGDGKLDLVVANGCAGVNQCTNGVVGVLRGNGDGTFQAAQSYSSGGLVATSVAIGKLNRGGYPDLAVANQCQDSTCQSGSVGVLLGNGDGTFQSAQSYASGGLTAVSLAIADFNKDGKLDLAVANQCQDASCANGDIGVLLGNGNGTFQAAQSYASGGRTAMSVAAGDFNGDKKIDLAVANQCSSTDCKSGSVAVLLGNGDGTFQAGQSFASGGNLATAVTVNDLRRDGRKDLLVANQCQAQGDCLYGSVGVLLGNGDGTFQATQSYISDGSMVSSLDTGNFRGHGKADLVIANQCQNSSSCSGAITVLLGNGDGTFHAPPTYSSAGYNADSIAVGDLNGDKKLDLVVANLCESNNCNNGNNGVISVLLGNGDGTFQAATSYSTGGFGTSAVAVADVNGDGNLDVVVANQCGASDCQSGGSVSVLLGNGDGTLQTAQSYASGAYTSLSVAIGDFNNDGKLDLAVASQCQDTSCLNGTVSVLLGNGDGSFQSAQTYPSAGYETNSLAIGDFNQDGNLDLAVASQCQDSTCQNGGVSVLLGNGNGTFQTAQSYSSAGAQADSVAVTDLNGDGRADLVVSNFCQSVSDCSQGEVTSLLGRGDGTFYPASRIGSGGQNTYSVVTGDFNGDGHQDAVVANSNNTSVLLGNGDGSFQAAIPYIPGGIFVSTGDFNGDGQPDLAIANGTLSTATILLNVVHGYRWGTSTTLTSSPNPSATYQSVLFTATVTTQGNGSPTGTVTFKQGSTVLGTGNVSNGQATLNYAFTSPGVDSITAVYSGNSKFLPSTSPRIKQKVVKAQTTTTLTSKPNPSQVGQTVTFTATVTGQYGGTPTGTVTFKDGRNVLAQVPLQGGVAQYQTSGLTKGKHHIWADYGGDASFRQSTGGVIQIVQ